MAKKKVNDTNYPLIAIDLGSNAVRSMAAESIGPNTLRILAVEQSVKHPCVDKGVVVQTADAGFSIRESLKFLANRIGRQELSKAFLLVGGRSTQVCLVHAKRDLIHPREVDQRLLNELKDECRQKIEARNPNVAVWGLVPAYYVVDGEEVEDLRTDTDVRVKATLLEAHFNAFVTKKEYADATQKSFNQAATAIEDTYVRMDALLSAFATEDESVLNDGCAVLDLGAQTTSLAVYKKGQYLTAKVVPQGGYTITRSIEQQGIPFRQAELIKCRYGWASPELMPNNPTLKIGPISLPALELSRLIRLKLDEMINPIIDALEPYKDRIRVLYVTGGGSMMNGIIEYLQKKLPIAMRVMYGSHAGLLASGTPDEYYMPQYSALVGALIMGADYRKAHPEAANDVPMLVKLKNQFEKNTLIIFTE